MSCPVLSVFCLIHSVLKYFYFAQIIPTFCEGRGGKGRTSLLTFLRDLVARCHVRVGGGDAGGEKRKPNTLPLSIECINIKFDSLASSLLPFVFVFKLTVVFENQLVCKLQLQNTLRGWMGMFSKI